MFQCHSTKINEDQVGHQKFTNCTNTHRIMRFYLNLRNDAERTFKYRQPNGIFPLSKNRFQKQSLPEACNFMKKETLPQVLSCEFCEISKNTFFCRTPLVAASEVCSLTLLLTGLKLVTDGSDFSIVSNILLQTLTVQKKKFSIKDLFSKCDQICTFTEEILNGKLHFLSSHFNEVA